MVLPTGGRKPGIPGQSRNELTDRILALGSTLEPIPDQVADIEAFKERTSTQRYDIREWLPAGSTLQDVEPGALFTTAIAEINAAGGGILTGPAGHYPFLAGFTLQDGVVLDFPQGAHFDFSTMTTPVNSSAIYGTGSYSALPALGASVARHSKTIQFATAPSLVPGDIFFLYDSAASSFSTARTYYRAGEFLRVASVSGTTVTCTTRTFAAYASGSTVSAYKMLPIHTGLQGFSATFKQGAYGIRLAFAADVLLTNLNLTGTDYSHIAFDRCYNVSANNNTIVDHSSPDAGLNYGIVIFNSQRVALTDNFVETSRHGVAHGGQEGVGTVPCREITIQGGTISSIGSSYGLDAHGNTEYLTVTNVNLPNGVSFGGDHIAIRGCNIWSGPFVFAISCSAELLGANVWIEDNNIEVTHVSTDTTPAAIRFEPRGVLTRSGGSAIIRGNRINMNGYTNPGYGAVDLTAILAYNSASPVLNNLTIADNEILGGPSTPGEAHAVYVRVASGMGWNKVRVRDNQAERMGYLIHNAALDIEVKGNRGYDSPGAGLVVTRFATSTAVTPKWIRVLDNVVERSYRLGISVRGFEGITRLEVARNRAVNCLQGGDSGNALLNGSFYLRGAIDAFFRDNIAGDDQSVPTQLIAYAFFNIDTVYERDTHLIGGPTTVTLNTVTNRYFSGRGSGTPEGAVTASPSSEFWRTDGGAVTTLYVKESGTGNTGWAAK